MHLPFNEQCVHYGGEVFNRRFGFVKNMPGIMWLDLAIGLTNYIGYVGWIWDSGRDVSCVNCVYFGACVQPA